MMKCLHELKPALAMVAVQISYAIVNVLHKIAISDGMNLKVVVAYRFIFATAFIFPLAFFIERKSRPKLTWMILFQAFLCGLFGGSLSNYLYLASMTLTSATLASAMTNLIPPITFILAVFFRMEKLNFGDIRGKAKILGSMLGIGGAAILTLYKGVEINIWSTHINLLHHGQLQLQAHSSNTNHVIGCLLGVCVCICLSLWLVIQTKMSERYPCQYSSTALMSIMASIQALAFALSTETDWSQWKLGWNIRLLTVSFAGTVTSGVVVVVIAWCVRMKGPVFVSVFNPLMLVLVAIASSLVLDEKMHLGSLLAAMIIVTGLYLVVWGKAKETMIKSTITGPSKLLESTEGQTEIVHIIVAGSGGDSTIAWTRNDDNNNNNGNGSKIAPDHDISKTNMNSIMENNVNGNH